LKITNWLSLSKQQQIDLINQTGSQTGLPPYAIEKDAWVTLVLRMLFRSEICPYLVFKGGTSLSKAYNLIERFSEDIDLAISRDYLGFGGELSRGQIRKLRRKSHDFSANAFPQILQNQLSEYGIEEQLYEITVPNIKISDQDPEIVHVNYKSVFEEESYLQSRVLIEISARSLMEPFESKIIQSLIDQNNENTDFSEETFSVNTVIPEKTFLEKLILLHEEFQKPKEKIRYHRMSRHLYDIGQIINTEYGKKAIENRILFENILGHREMFTPVKTVDYKKLTLKSLSFLPPDDFLDLYRIDYREIQTNLIYGESLKFNKLIEQLISFKNLME